MILGKSERKTGKAKIQKLGEIKERSLISIHSVMIQMQAINLFGFVYNLFLKVEVIIYNPLWHSLN